MEKAGDLLVDQILDGIKVIFPIGALSITVLTILISWSFAQGFFITLGMPPSLIVFSKAMEFFPNFWIYSVVIFVSYFALVLITYTVVRTRTLTERLPANLLQLSTKHAFIASVLVACLSIFWALFAERVLRSALLIHISVFIAISGGAIISSLLPAKRVALGALVLAVILGGSLLIRQALISGVDAARSVLTTDWEHEKSHLAIGITKAEFPPVAILAKEKVFLGPLTEIEEQEGYFLIKGRRTGILRFISELHDTYFIFNFDSKFVYGIAKEKIDQIIFYPN